MGKFGSKTGIKVPSGIYNALMTRTENLLDNIEQSVALSVGSVFLDQGNNIKNINDLRNKTAGKSLLLSGLRDIKNAIEKSSKTSNKYYKDSYALLKDSKKSLEKIFDNHFFEPIIPIDYTESINTIISLLSSSVKSSESESTTKTILEPITQIDYTDKLNDIISLLNSNKTDTGSQTITVAIKGLNNKSINSLIELGKLKFDENSIINQNILDNFNKLIEVLEKLSENNSADLSGIKQIIPDLKSVINDVFKIFKKIDDFDAIESSKNVEEMSKYFDSLSNLFKQQIIVSRQANHAIEANKHINESLDNISETAVKTNEHIDDIKQSSSNMTDVGTFIMLCGATMLIGSMFMSNKRMMDSIKFGVTLGLFIASVLLPIELIKHLSENADISYVNKIKAFIFTCGIILLIGAAVMLIPDIANSALKFGITLSLFISAVMLPIVLYSKIIDDNIESVNKIKSLIVACAAVMMFGALFTLIDNGKLISKSLLFGLALSAFIGVVLMPILFFGKFSKTALEHLKDISVLVLTCTIVMSLGALFVTLGGGKFIINALMFGMLLSAFIASVLFPILVFSMLEAPAMKGLKQITILVMVASTVMMIGALFLTIGGGKLAINALKFTGLLALFITGILTPILIFSIFADQALKELRNVTIFVMVSAITLMLGALFVSNTDNIINALLFTVILDAFIFGVITPFLVFKKQIAAANRIALNLTILIGICSAVLIVGALFIKEFGAESILIFASILVGFLTVMGIAFSILNKFSKHVSKGIVVAKLMAIAISALAISLYLVSASMKEFTLAEGGLFLAAVACLGGIFAILGVPTVALFVALGSAVAATMSIGLSALSVAFLILHTAVHKTNPLEDATKLNEALPVAINSFAYLLKNTIILTLSIASVSIFSLLLTELSISFAIMHSVAKNNLKDDITTLNSALIGMTALFSNIETLIPSTTAILKLILKLEAVKILAYNINVIFGYLTDAISDYAALKVATKWNVFGKPIKYRLLSEKDFENAAKGVSTILTTLATAISDTIDNNPWMFEIGFLNKLLKITLLSYAEGEVLSTLSTALKDYAVLKIPTKWNALGIAIDYRELTPNDFNNVGLNISKVMLTLASSISKVYNDNEELFGVEGFYILDRVKALVMTEGKILSELSEGISQYAALKIPTKWNASGKAIDFRPMNTNDFINAATNISAVMMLLANTISSLWTGKGFSIQTSNGIVNIKGIGNGLQELDGGFFGTSVKEIFNTFLPIGELVSSISESISAYSKLSFPNKWDSNGRPIGYRPIEANDFTNAGINISKVILATLFGNVEDLNNINKSSITGGIIGAYNILEENDIEDEVQKIMDSITPIGDLISGISESLAAYTKLQIPIQWDPKTGKPSNYRTLTDTDFTNAGLNISRVILATLVGDANIENINKKSIKGGIIGAYNILEENDIEEDIKEIIEAITPIGEFIKNIADGVLSYASGMIPVQWNNEGKPVLFRQISDSDYDAAAQNIGNILSIVGTSIISFYNTNKTMFSSDGKFGEVMDSISGIGEFVKNIADGVKAYAEGGIPEWKDGKIIGYEPWSDTYFDSVGKNIENILTCVGRAVVSVYNSDNFSTTFGKSGDFEKAINSISKIGNTVKNIVEGIQAYANLRIPTKWDSDGKPIKFDKMEDTEINKAKGNIALLITSLAESINIAYNGGKIDNKEITGISSIISDSTFLDEMNEVSSKIISIVKNFSEIITNISNLKIPKGFDESGKATGYDVLQDTAITNAKTNITLLLTELPRAVYDAYNIGKKDLFSTDKNENSYIDKLTNIIPSIINVLSATMNGLGNVINNFDSLEKILKYNSKYNGTTPETLTIGLFKDTYGVLNELSVISGLLKSINSNFIILDTTSISYELNAMSIIMDNVGILSDKLAIIIDSSILAIDKYNKYSNSINITNFGLIKDSINSSIEFINSIVNMIYSNSAINLSSLNFNDNIYKKLNDEIIKLNGTLSLLFVSISNIYNTFDTNKTSILNFSKSKMFNDNSVISNMIYDINNFISELVSNVDINKNIKLLNELQIFIYLFTETLINEKNGLINALNNIVLNINKLDNIINYNASASSDGTIITNKMRPIINDINNTVLLLNSLSNIINDTNVYKVIDLTGKSLNVLADGISKILFEMSQAKENTTFNKNIHQLEKFINNTINKINVDKIDRLTELVVALNQLADRTTNLDSLTNAIANNLTEVLQVLASKMDEAKGTFEVMDEIQKRRHDLINKSVEKIKDILAQQITVKVTAENNSFYPSNTNTDEITNNNNNTGGTLSSVNTGRTTNGESNDLLSNNTQNNKQQNNGNKKYNTSSTDSLLNNIYKELCKITK